MRAAACAAALTATALSACGTAWASRSGSTATAAARPRGCAVEFLREPPQRKYEKIAELYSYYSHFVDVEDALRPKACELGADAVLVTLDHAVVSGRSAREGWLVAGDAIRYADANGPAPSQGG